MTETKQKIYTTNSLYQSVPSSAEAEKALLGSMLLDNDVIYAISIKPEDFYFERHAWIFDAMRSLSREGKPIDTLTLIARLELQGKINDIGGSSYIISLLNETPTATNYKAYAEVIQKCAVQRRLINASTQIAGLAYEGKTDSDELIAEAHKTLLSVERPQSNAEGTTLNDAVADFIPELEDYLSKTKDYWGVPTGLVDLDNFIGGLAFNEMTLIAADPARGKSFLAMTIWLNAGIMGYPGVFFSLEMQRRQLMLRLYAERGNLSTYDIRKGNVTENEKGNMLDAMDRVHNLPLWIYDNPMDTASIARAIMKLQRQVELKLAIIDYSGLLRDKSSHGEVQRQMDISHALKYIAKETGIAMLVVHPITRGANRDTDPPTLSDLGWGRVWEYDCHTCLFPFFLSKRQDHSALIKVGKYRDGIADRKIDMIFDGRRWRNAAK